MVDFLDYVEYDSLTESQKKVADCIGMDEFIQLVRIFEGRHFKVPKMSSIIVKIKKRIVLDDYFIRHLSYKDICEKHNLTQHYVHTILKNTEKGQKSIFQDKSKRQKRNQGIIHDRTVHNLSAEQLAKKYSISKSRVYGILEENTMDSQDFYETSIKDDAIIQDYLAGGLTLIEISEKYGISKFTLCRILRAAKVTNRAKEKSIKTKNRNEQLIADYNTHKFTIRELAQKYNITTSLIYVILKEHRNRQGE